MYFKLIGDRLFTYPSCCIRPRNATYFPLGNGQAVVDVFIQNIMSKVPSICGARFSIEQTARYPEPELGLPSTMDTNSQQNYNLTSAPKKAPGTQANLPRSRAQLQRGDVTIAQGKVVNVPESMQVNSSSISAKTPASSQRSTESRPLLDSRVNSVSRQSDRGHVHENPALSQQSQKKTVPIFSAMKRNTSSSILPQRPSSSQNKSKLVPVFRANPLKSGAPQTNSGNCVTPKSHSTSAMDTGSSVPSDKSAIPAKKPCFGPHKIPNIPTSSSRVSNPGPGRTPGSRSTPGHVSGSLKSLPGQTLKSESLAGKIPKSGLTPSNSGQMSRSGSTPVSGSTPGRIPVSGSTPGRMPVSGSIPGQIPRSGSTPGQIPRSGSPPIQKPTLANKLSFAASRETRPITTSEIDEDDFLEPPTWRPYSGGSHGLGLSNTPSARGPAIGKSPMSHSGGPWVAKSFGQKPTTPKIGNNHSQTSVDQSPASKKPRQKPKIQEGVDIEALARANQLNKVNTATLLNWLRDKGVKCKAKDKKTDLVDKATFYVNMMRCEH